MKNSPRWCRTGCQSISVSEADRIFLGAGGHHARAWGPLDGGTRGAVALGRGRAGCIPGGGEGLEVGRKRDREFWGRGWGRARDLFL